MFKSRNSRGFTLAELAAILGVTALMASVLSPVVMNSGTDSVASSTITVADSSVMAEPETLPVEAILVNVTNTATGATVQKTVNDPTATSTIISGLDSQANYTVEVAKKSQAGVSPKATAKVNYVKVGEDIREASQYVKEEDAQSVSREGSVRVVSNGKATRKVPQPNKQVLKGYQKKTISVPAYIQTTASQGSRQVTKTRSVYVPPSTYTYTGTCTGTRTENYSTTCYGTRTESYSYSCTKTGSRTKYCTGGGGTKYCSGSYTYNCGTSKKPKTCSQSYTYACGSYPTYSYPCGSESYTYTGTCTGTREVSYASSCTKQRDVSYTYSCQKTGTNPGYYRDEDYTDTEYYTVRSDAPAAEGTCAANGTVGSWTGVTYSCTNTTISKQVDDTTKPIYDSVPQPDKTEEAPVETYVVDGAGSCPGGFSAVSTGSRSETVSFADGFNGTKTVTVSVPVVSCFKPEKGRVDKWNYTVDIKKAVTTAKEVKAPAGQLVVQVAGTPTRSMNWATGTVVAVGSGATGFAAGETVNFRMGQVFTFDGKKYVKVPAKSYLVKK